MIKELYGIIWMSIAMAVFYAATGDKTFYVDLLEEAGIKLPKRFK